MIFEALSVALARGELLLVEGGMCHFHRRRDGQVTIREILVLPSHQRRGIGRRLIERASQNTSVVVAKCPVDLPSNAFWLALGFRLVKVETTSTGRSINVWQRLCV